MFTYYGQSSDSSEIKHFQNALIGSIVKSVITYILSAVLCFYLNYSTELNWHGFRLECVGIVTIFVYIYWWTCLVRWSVAVKMLEEKDSREKRERGEEKKMIANKKYWDQVRVKK